MSKLSQQFWYLIDQSQEDTDVGSWRPRYSRHPVNSAKFWSHVWGYTIEVCFWSLFSEYTHKNYANFTSSVFSLQIETFQYPFYSIEGTTSSLPLRVTQHGNLQCHKNGLTETLCLPHTACHLTQHKQQVPWCPVTIISFHTLSSQQWENCPPP